MEIDWIGILFYTLLAIPVILLAIFVFTPLITLLIYVGAGVIMVGVALWNILLYVPRGIKALYRGTVYVFMGLTKFARDCGIAFMEGIRGE